ncbi:MAG: hypothetical protein RIC80_12630 [Cyclobacteriaceae bacterium]
MIHKIAFPSLIIFILFLIAFAFIKASEAEMQTELAYKESVRADLMRTELQDCSAIAAEEAARAHMAQKKQRNRLK